MRSPSPFVRLGRAAAVAVLSAGSIARAQTLAPPKLSQFVEATDPRAPGPAERSSVELEIDIDPGGAVTDVRVVRSATPDLDAAAVEAAKKFAFEPATRDGKPVAALIRYEYVFAAREAPPVAVVRTSSIAGAVRDRDTRKPIGGAEIVVTAAGKTFRAKTDERGGFRIDGIEPGAIHLTVTAGGHLASGIDETLDPGTLTETTLDLDTPSDPEAFTATARVDPPPREVTKRQLEPQELGKIAGTRGDPLRAIELLPSVSRPAIGGTLPIIRGANPFDSQVFLDGAPVPSLYHFANLTSFMHSRVLDSVELYPSNFSVRYGRKVGGIIEAKVRDPKTDGLHGVAEASFLDTSLLVETPVGEKVSALAAVRRSSIDAVLNSAQSFGDLGITAAPVYWDYQAIAAFKPTDQDRIRILSYGSNDRFGIVLANPSEADPTVRGGFDLTSGFHRVQLGYRHRFAGGSEGNTELTYGHTAETGRFGGIGTFDLTINSVQARSEWTGVVSPALRVIGGVDLLGNFFDGRYEGPPPPPDEGERPSALSTQRRVAVDATKFVGLPGAYVEAGIRPFPELLLAPGVRADYNALLKEAAVDPRFSLRLDATESTALKAGIGRFSQSPDERHVIEGIGNPNLGMTHALHASAGFEHKVSETFTASLEGFGKWVDGVVTTTPGGRAPFFVNTQEGRIFGGELMLRVRPRGRFFGFLAYTLMRSERRDPNEAWRLFDRDQPHIVNATGVYRLGRGWEVGASIRYTSGVPYTPIVGATYDATNDVYSPRGGRPFSARNPAFSRIDLRVQKTWTFSSWSLSAYLDVQNVLNSPNREGFEYSYDYRRREGDRGLPILPILGLRGEL